MSKEAIIQIDERDKGPHALLTVSRFFQRQDKNNPKCFDIKKKQELFLALKLNIIIVQLIIFGGDLVVDGNGV